MLDPHYRPVTGPEVLEALREVSEAEISDENDDGYELNADDFLDGADEDLQEKINTATELLEGYLFPPGGEINRRGLTFLTKNGFPATEGGSPYNPDLVGVVVELPNSDYHFLLTR